MTHQARVPVAMHAAHAGCIKCRRIRVRESGESFGAYPVNKMFR
jgi:hypothetical protein